MPYEVAPPAQREVEAILAYRAEVAGWDSARRLRDEFVHLFQLIGSGHMLGSPRPEWAHGRYRFFPKGDYWIIWRESTVNPAHRVIVMVIDARRDVARILHGLDR